MKANTETDLKWWELVEEAEVAVLQTESSSRADTSETLGGDEADHSDETLGGEVSDDSDPASTTEDATEGTPTRRARLAGLSQRYTDELTGQRYDVEAFSVRGGRPATSRPPLSVGHSQNYRWPLGILC